MRGLRSTGGGVELVDGPDEAPGVAVRVRSSGICGSDLHLAAMGPMPVILGHEFAGLLEDGTAVAVCPMIPCGSCDQCAAGHEQRCRTLVQRIYGVSLNGGLADVAFVDERCLLELPSGVDVADGALVEPLAVAAHGLVQAGLAGAATGAPAGPILVVGGGAIGLAAVAMARHLGIQVDLVARHDAQRERGAALGAGEAADGEYPVVLDAAGTQSAFDRAVAAVVPGGVVVEVGSFWDPVAVGHGLLGKEARLVPASMYGHRHGAREFELAAEALAARPELAGHIVSHRFGLDDAPEAFAVAGDRAHGSVKVVVHPN